MKTRLASRPLIHGWMTPANKKFRTDFPRYATRLPDYSFLDKASFKVDGYFVGNNIGSVVLKISDNRGTYIAKTTLKPETVLAEAGFLGQWRKVGGNTLKVLELIKPQKEFPYAVAILEYISTKTSEAEAEKRELDLAPIYERLGRSLTALHRAKSKGFGEVVNLKNLTGQYKTFGGHARAILNPKHLRTLAKNNLLTDEDRRLIRLATKIVDHDIREGTKPVLIHNDCGLFNTFGISTLKFFDPDPKISHPLEDLSVALIWASFEDRPQRMREALLRGYKSQQPFDDRVLHACLFLKLFIKWEWWLQRGATEKKALGWIKKTKALSAKAKKRISI